MPVLRLLALLTALCLTLPLPAPAQGYDPAAPCGRDAAGNPIPCRSVSAHMLEATCLTSANPYYCLPYHRRVCQTNGFPAACRLAGFGQHCMGGDPGACSYYVTLLRANTDCNLNGHAPACGWLAQQGF